VQLIVALQTQKLKLNIKKNVDVYRSLLRDLGGESDRLRRRVAANRIAREELGVDDGAETYDHEEEEEKTIAHKELTDMYVKASEVDDRYKEFNEIVWVHYDPNLDRCASVAQLGEGARR
jgi:hypothetical protein